MFLVLSNMTGLRLHPLAPENDSDSEEDRDDPESKKDTTEQISDKGAGTSSSNDDEKNPVKKSEVKRKQKLKIDPKCKIEVRRWRQGSYTLLNDAKANNDKYFLDGRLFFNCEDWNIEQVKLLFSDIDKSEL